jgi:hypothetical protein
VCKPRYSPDNRVKMKLKRLYKESAKELPRFYCLEEDVCVLRKKKQSETATETSQCVVLLFVTKRNQSSVGNFNPWAI